MDESELQERNTASEDQSFLGFAEATGGLKIGKKRGLQIVGCSGDRLGKDDEAGGGVAQSFGPFPLIFEMVVARESAEEGIGPVFHVLAP